MTAQQTKDVKKEQINRQMTIEDILSSFPQKAQRLAQEMNNIGLQCVGCHAATWETLEAGILGHGLPESMIDKFVEKLNNILAEKQDLSTITLTERAANKFMEILESENQVGYGLRFAEKMAGCNGFEYLLDFSEKASEEDTVFVSNGVEIHINKVMVPKLIGAEIDYIDGLQNAGFKISNPNVRSSCGCGTSHGY